MIHMMTEGALPSCKKKMESGVLKNVIESADYYPVHVNAGRTFCVSFQGFVSSLRVLSGTEPSAPADPPEEDDYGYFSACLYATEYVFLNNVS